MKQLYFFALLLTALWMPAKAAPPTITPSNPAFSSYEGGSFTFSFTRGNGGSRIVVVKEGSEVTGSPVDGMSYTANQNFGTAGTAFTAAGEYVVYAGAGNSVNIRSLKPGTVYHIKVFEYNNLTGTIEYLTIPLSTSTSTLGAPTTNATNLHFTAVVGNEVTLNWTNGNGSSRIVLARKGAPVNGVPENLSSYSSSTNYGDGAEIGDGSFVVGKTTTTRATISNLEPNTTYYFAVHEYNGTNAPVYYSTANTAQVTTHAGPTTPSWNPQVLSVEGNRFTINTANGNGTYRLTIMSKDPVTAVPVNGVQYTANAAFGSGQEIAPGQFVVSTTNVRTFTNLEPATTYYMRVYEYDVTSAGFTYYLTSQSLSFSGSTVSAPTQEASNLLFDNITGNSTTLRFQRGNGSYALVLLKEGAPVDILPSDLTRYTGNSTFGSSVQLGTGNYVIHGGMNGSAVSILGLVPGKTYHAAIFEYNGTNYPIYRSTPARASLTIPNQPTTAATNFAVSSREGNSFRIGWTNGNGSRRMIIATKGSEVSSLPADGTNYTADDDFGLGQEIAPGEFVVYNGTAAAVTINNLDPSSTYHFAVFDYNTTEGSPDYLTSTFLKGSASTVSVPSVSTNNLVASNVQQNRATISFTSGNGDGRIFIIRESDPVNAAPVQLTNYNYNYGFGTITLSGDNYIIAKRTDAAAFTATNLQPGKTYHIAVYEYNGSSAPVYNATPTLFSFTTLPSADITPTVPATNASFSNIDGNKITLTWTNGNGANRIVIARKNNPVTFAPVNGTTYASAAQFGTGSAVGTDHYIVYNNNNSSVTISGLEPASTYHFSIVEYNGADATSAYLTASPLTASASTAVSPVTPSSAPIATTGETTANLQWTKGSGSGRLVVLKENGAVTGNPVDLNKYTANTAFRSGAQIGLNEFVVYSGTGNSVSVTGLTANTTYHYEVFEYNGSDAPVYNTTGTTGSFVTTGPLPLSWVSFKGKQQDGKVQLEWVTADEYNTSHFIVERSEGNGNFRTIGNVSAKGGNGENSYSFTDQFPLKTQAIYRLKQVDTDGQFEYSQSIRIGSEQERLELKLFPNPAPSMVTLSIARVDAVFAYRITDNNGSTVKMGNTRNGVPVSLSGLKAGVYHVQVWYGGKVVSGILLKR